MNTRFTLIVSLIPFIVGVIGMVHLYNRTTQQETRTIITATDYEFNFNEDVTESAFLYFNIPIDFISDCNDSIKENQFNSNYHEIIIALNEDKYYLTCQEFLDLLKDHKVPKVLFEE